MTCGTAAGDTPVLQRLRTHYHALAPGDIEELCEVPRQGEAAAQPTT